MTKISCNPFAFHTAAHAWSRSDSSNPTRLAKATGSAMYDVFVKNPYDMTIGNAQTLIFSKKKLKMSEKVVAIAAIAFGTCYSLMLYGTSVHLVGRAIQALAISAKMSTGLKAAASIQNLGKNLFVAGGVPIYALFYALPKKIISYLPHALNALADKIQRAAVYVFKHIALPAWNKVIYPALRELGKLVDVAARKLAHVTEQLFKRVIVPFWNKVLYPALQEVARFAEWIGPKVVKAIEACARRVATLFRWTCNHVLIPLWKNVLSPIFSLLNKAIRQLGKQVFVSIAFLVKKAARVAIWTINNTITPLCKKVLLPIAKTITQSLSYLAKKTARGGQWLIKNVLSPLWVKVLQPALVTLFKASNWAFLRIGKAVSSLVEKTAAAAQVVFSYIIAPAFDVMKKGTHKIAHSFQALQNEIARAFQSLAHVRVQ